MSNIVKYYFKILEFISSLKIVLSTENRVGRRFKVIDLEIVVSSLTSEYMSVDSENSLFNQLQEEEQHQQGFQDIKFWNLFYVLGLSKVLV